MITAALFIAINGFNQSNNLPVPNLVKLTDSLASTPVQDQAQSPTCWAFGTNSLFEADLLKKYNTTVNLSEMFIARHAYIDKARQYLKTGGKTYFEGGGQFHDVIRVISQHGMVPEQVYRGCLNEELYHNHTRLEKAMKTAIENMLQQDQKDLDNAGQRQLEDTLDKYLGKLPTTFEYKQKTYTAKTFARDVLKFDNDFVEIVSFADQPLYKQFILADKYNWANDSFYNVTLADLQTIVDTALHKGWSVGWEGDVTEAGFSHFGGFASFPDSTHQYDQERLLNYKTEATERDHMLHILGMGRDTDGRKWYYMKNSWGTFSKYKGFLFMEDNYFRLKTVILFVNKKGLPDSLKNKLGIR